MSDAYLNNGQQRLISVIKQLVGHELDGITAAELARELEEGTAAVFRDLKNLEAAGWAQKLEHSGGWRLTPGFAELLRTVQRNIMTVMEKVNRLNIEYIQGESQYGDY